MSRQIDENKPLSDEDRKFLMQNGQENRVRQHDERLGTAASTPAYMTGMEPSLLVGAPAFGMANAPGISPSQAASALGDPAMLLGIISTEALEAELERRAEAEEESEEDESEPPSVATSEVVRESEEGVPDYDEWKVDTLKAQLGVRELNKSGNKSELVDRLREDDTDS